MATPPTTAVVLFCADVPKLTAFYGAVAGMTLSFADDQHAILGLPGFELVLHILRNEPPVTPGPDSRVPVREDSYTKLCLPVTNIDAARVVAAMRGGAIQPPDREWSGRDFVACDGHDPEGNVIQVRAALP